MKKTTLLLALSIVIAFAGCGTTETVKTADSPTTAPANVKTSDAPVTTKAETGVASCDEYLAAVEKLLNNLNVPQATRDAFRQSQEQNRAAWKQAASVPQDKTQLETSCKMALDSIKPTVEQYGR